jgi:hypothetical protein
MFHVKYRKTYRLDTNINNYKQKKWTWIKNNDPGLAQFLKDIAKNFGKPREVELQQEDKHE